MTVDLTITASCYILVPPRVWPRDSITLENHSVQQPWEAHSMQHCNNHSVEPRDNYSVGPRDNHSVEPRGNHSVEPRDNHSVQPRDNHSVQPRDITFRPTLNVMKIASEFIEAYHISVLTAG